MCIPYVNRVIYDLYKPQKSTSWTWFQGMIIDKNHENQTSIFTLLLFCFIKFSDEFIDQDTRAPSCIPYISYSGLGIPLIGFVFARLGLMNLTLFCIIMIMNCENKINVHYKS